MLCLLAGGLPTIAEAAQVVVTITGTLNGGMDQTGVFGAAHTDLTGKAFKLVYTFDDTKGQETVSNCNGVPCVSVVTGAGASSPGTAVLTIGGGSFSFGTFNGGADANSEVSQSAPPNYSSVYYLVNEHSTYFSAAVEISISPASGTPPLTTNYDWRGSFSDSQLNPNSGGQCGISQAIQVGPIELASGGLVPTSISVVGLAPTNPPAQPKILRDGTTDVTGTTQSVMVGQKIALTASLPTGATLAAGQPLDCAARNDCRGIFCRQ